MHGTSPDRKASPRHRAGKHRLRPTTVRPAAPIPAPAPTTLRAALGACTALTVACTGLSSCRWKGHGASEARKVHARMRGVRDALRQDRPLGREIELAGRSDEAHG